MASDIDEVNQDEATGGDRLKSNAHDCSFMSRVLERENLIQAYNQVVRNKGSAGVDGMTVAELSDYLKQTWPMLKRKLERGSYYPNAVKRVYIDKAQGGRRPLGIPTVLDRFIQQSIAQVLQRDWEGDFHANSYGFRPNKNAHQAIWHVQSGLLSGKTHVVDCDLSRFFDTVNHDRLMMRLKTKLQDRTALTLIHRFLKAAISDQGERTRNVMGVPQGGPLSPLLANIVLDELDWELEARGHYFARYADDFVILVASRAAADRVLASTERYVSRHLKLTVNADKSAVGRPWERTFLGFTFSRGRGFRRKVSAQALKKLKALVRDKTRRVRGRSLVSIIEELKISLLGWRAYFGIAEVVRELRDIDKWIRRRLRSYQLTQWGRSGYRRLRRLGVDRQLAWNTAKSAHGPWRLSHSPALYRALPNRYFSHLGLPSVVAK